MTDAEWAESIKPGDKVVVDTVDGKRMEFKVAVVEPGWIIGGGERVRREDISTLEVERRGFTKWFAESKFDGGGRTFGKVIKLDLMLLLFSIREGLSSLEAALIFWDNSFREARRPSTSFWSLFLS